MFHIAPICRGYRVAKIELTLAGYRQGYQTGPSIGFPMVAERLPSYRSRLSNNSNLHARGVEGRSAPRVFL
jgi:hypothetical protein